MKPPEEGVSHVLCLTAEVLAEVDRNSGTNFLKIVTADRGAL